MGLQVGWEANEKKKITKKFGLPIQPARSEHIIKHNRDREPSGGEGEGRMRLANS